MNLEYVVPVIVLLLLAGFIIWVRRLNRLPKQIMTSEEMEEEIEEVDLKVKKPFPWIKVFNFGLILGGTLLVVGYILHDKTGLMLGWLGVILLILSYRFKKIFKENNSISFVAFKGKFFLQGLVLVVGLFIIIFLN